MRLKSYREQVKSSNYLKLLDTKFHFVLLHEIPLEVTIKSFRRTAGLRNLSVKNIIKKDSRFKIKRKPKLSLKQTQMQFSTYMRFKRIRMLNKF